MKIAVICTSDTIGGAAISTTRLTNALSKHGAEAQLIVLKKGSKNLRNVLTGKESDILYWLSIGIKKTEIARRCKVNPSTIFRFIRQFPFAPIAP